jgi:branched-chain amino acid transport system substrate-binding protein
MSHRIKKLSAGVLAPLCLAMAVGWSSPASASSTSSSGANAGTIVVGTVCNCTGPVQSTLGDAGQTAQAWASWVNKNGGIQGHHVKMIVMDDADNPTTSLADIHQLVQQDHVVAIVGATSGQDAEWDSYLQSAGVPVVGGDAYEVPYATDSNFFASGATTPVVMAGVVGQVKADGKKKLGIMYCVESPSCGVLASDAKTAAAKRGVAFTSAEISATAPNYTAECQQFKDEGVDALDITDAAAIDVRVAADCASIGYTPKEYAVGGTTSNLLLANKLFNGLSIIKSNPGTEDTQVPGVKTAVTNLNKFSPGITSSTNWSDDAMWSWIGGELFRSALLAAGKLPTTVSSADVLRGLYALKGVTLNGFSGPITFTKGKSSYPLCYFVGKIQNGTYSRSKGPICVSQSQIAH